MVLHRYLGKKLRVALTDTVDTIGGGIEDAAKSVAGAFESIF
jgi:hypothetical protein